MKTLWRIYEKMTIAIWMALVLPPLIIIGLLMRIWDSIDEAPFRG